MNLEKYDKVGHKSISELEIGDSLKFIKDKRFYTIKEFFNEESVKESVKNRDNFYS